MKRKLLLFNLALLGLIGLSVRQIQIEIQAARQREEAFRKAKPPESPKLDQPLPSPPSPKSAAEFFVVAQKLLTSADRNPDVIVEVVQPKPMPPLPAYFGVMDFGQGPTVILQPEGEPRQRGYHLGEMVGEFKLLGVNHQELLLEWEGKKVNAKLSELMAKKPPVAVAKAKAADAAEPPKPVAPKKVVPVAQGRPGPGSPGDEARPCVEGDTSPEGTVAEGYRKTITRTPFSNVCMWVKLK